MSASSDRIDAAEKNTQAAIRSVRQRMSGLLGRERFKATDDLAALTTELATLSAQVTAWQAIVTDMQTRHP